MGTSLSSPNPSTPTGMFPGPPGVEGRGIREPVRKLRHRILKVQDDGRGWKSYPAGFEKMLERRFLNGGRRID